MEMRQIANPKNEDMGGYWHEEKDDMEIDAIYTPKGVKIADSWNIGVSEILQQRPFARTPDDTDTDYPDCNDFAPTPDVCDLHINIYYDTATPPNCSFSRSGNSSLNLNPFCLMNVCST